MSDTTKLILAVVLAVVVIALIIWLVTSARRREAEARRMEAEAMRAKLAEKVPVVQDRADRASVTARIAEEARRDAEEAAARAEQLERDAAADKTEAQQLQDEQEQLARAADRLDPDVRTDAEGYRVDESGRRLSVSPVASTLGMAALAQDEEEPDLADHENPFAAYGTESAGEGEPSSSESSGQNGRPDERDPDWVNSPVDEDAADELEAQAASDAEAADWINGPEDDAPAGSAHSTGSESSAHSSAQDLTSESAGERAESEHSTGDESSAQSSAQDRPSDSAGVDEGAPFDTVDEEAAQPPAARRISGLDEVVDGGYGIGSAAPIDDRAQPLGHPVKGFHETRTFVAPEAEGYDDAEPDVWFYDEDSARRAGFHAAGED